MECIDVLDNRFPEQCGFILDESKLKALWCTRRSAKSYTAGLYLIKEALEHAGSNCLFLGLTRLSAQGIIWKDVLKIINRKHRLGVQFNNVSLTATLPNGSVIWVTGIDSDEEEMNKLLGRKYRLCCLDEASMYNVNLRRLIYGVLKPAVADDRGTICMLGTSSDVTQGLFYDITMGKEPGWKLFQWDAHKNPYVARQWAEELADIEAHRPLFKETALYKQWYLNQWVVDTNKLVYTFDAQKNCTPSLPHYPKGEWQYVLGVDLGYSPDPSAFVVAAFHEHDSCLYFVHTYKALEMDITDVANKIKAIQREYPAIYKVIIDGSNKQAVQEMQKRHDIALTNADKREKADFIALMNAELVQAKIKLLPSSKELSEEWDKLIWQLDGDKIRLPRKEHPGLANHLADAALYAWRYCYPFLSKPAPVAINIGRKEEWVAHTEKLLQESLQREIDEQEAYERGEDYWNTSIMDDQKDILSYYLNRRKK